MTKKAVIAIILTLFLIGCGTETVPESEPEVEEPYPAPGEVLVDEEVIIPAHEPEPEPEPEVEEPQGDILTEHKDSKNFLHGRPDVGDVISDAPRRVNLVFSYPIGKGTEVEVWDENEEHRYHDGDDTVLADEDNLVAIAYLDDMGPGIYKVEYNVIFVTEKEGTDTGYYYFKVE